MKLNQEQENEIDGIKSLPFCACDMTITRDSVEDFKKAFNKIIIEEKLSDNLHSFHGNHPAKRESVTIFVYDAGDFRAAYVG